MRVFMSLHYFKNNNNFINEKNTDIFNTTNNE